MDGGIGIIVIVAVVVIIILVLITLVTRQYHRVPPNEVMVIYGRGDARMVTNGGAFIMPVIETYKKLDITIMTIKQEKDEVYTVSGVPIRLDWVAQVQIAQDEASLRTAARAFLDKSREEVRDILNETLSANFRAIVGQMSVEAIHRDRDSFVQKVQDLARDDVAAMGVQVIAMGIEEINDDQGYLVAMAAPQIAAVKRDAQIAEAEAEREARVKAATAKREAEQAELDAERQILQQREALSIREVEVEKTVGLARAASDQEVQQKRALAVAQQQEAEVLVPARAQGQSVEIQAEAERRRVTINAQADAESVRTRAEAEAKATEQRGRAQAQAYQAMQEAEAAGDKAKRLVDAEAERALLLAEAEGTQAKALADAEGVRAKSLAEAEGVKAQLLAEAEGRRELAAASAAENEINLRQFLIEQIMQADVAKVKAMAEAMAGLGGNVRVVHFAGNGNGTSGGTGNSFMDLLMNIPEVTEVFRAKVESLSGEDFETSLARVAHLFGVLKGIEQPSSESSPKNSKIELSNISKTDAKDIDAEAPAEGDV